MACAKPTPPRSLNVHKFAESRAPELESLHSVISSRLNDDFRIGRSKRRRTTGHRTAKGRRRKRQKIGQDQEISDAKDKPYKKPPRRVRRRMELRANMASGFSASGDGTQRLRTHLWYVKRFTMVKQWGFQLPLGLQGSGRGSRAVLKWLKSGALVHDASYCHPVQLEGSEESILDILRMVLVPSRSSVSNITKEVSQAVLSGVFHENALLYHVGTPLTKFICPVIYMWRPPLREDDCSSVEKVSLPNEHHISDENECTSSYRQLWVWIHAAAFPEGFDALRFACQKQMNESGTSVSCSSLEGHIGKLEILGSKAVQILQEILHPVSESGAVSAHSEVQKSLFLSQADQLPSHSILSLTVHEPRKLPSSEPESYMKDEVLQDSNSTKNEDFMLSMWSNPEAHGIFLSESKELWDSSNKLNPPVPDNIICMERHNKRLNYLNLNHALDGKPGNEADGSFDQSCSILLLKHTNQGNQGTRWSIILPLSWVKVFWMCLVSRGARAIGLRERRWIACNSGLPCFPFDFPDSKAYSLHMTAEAAAFDKEAERRPLAVRPSRVPLPPPWDCLMSTIKKGPEIIRDPQTLDICETSSLTSEQAGESFQGLVMRTSSVLGKYVEQIHGRQLLLFPNPPMGNEGFSDLADSDKLSWITQINLVPAGREPCLVRILLHAYKEGAFEEGAIVCAPIISDLTRWSSRSEDNETLEIPQSLVRSYFTEKESGKWELQVPEDDPSTLQSYRWPIGFVTTGFVRGSAKPVAEAFCEARLLSMLRGMQLSQTRIPRREIFVLVRNVRSTAYRRALATIVLEQQQQQDDLEFM